MTRQAVYLIALIVGSVGSTCIAYLSIPSRTKFKKIVLIFVVIGAYGAIQITKENDESSSKLIVLSNQLYSSSIKNIDLSYKLNSSSKKITSLALKLDAKDDKLLAKSEEISRLNRELRIKSDAISAMVTGGSSYFYLRPLGIFKQEHLGQILLRSIKVGSDPLYDVSIDIVDNIKLAKYNESIIGKTIPINDLFTETNSAQRFITLGNLNPYSSGWSHIIEIPDMCKQSYISYNI